MVWDSAVSFGGLIGFMVLAWLFSVDRKRVNWRVVLWGIALQFLFAAFIFIVPAGSRFFLMLNDVVVGVLDCAARGSEFAFGVLALEPGKKDSLGFILAFQALPTIIFFSALISLLYYCRIMPLVVRFFARIFTTLMKISGAEALVAASNIFVGVESAFTVKPFIKNMTKSELCTMLTAGMATVGSNVLALYVFSLQGVFPTIAGHLVTASILSAPAAIVMAKLIWPESEVPETLDRDVRPHYVRPDNFFLAIIDGSQEGLKVIFGIIALLIAVLGLTALIDMILGAVAPGFCLKMILGYVAYPLTYMLGVTPNDVPHVAVLIGEKLVLTEVVAYLDLAVMIGDNVLQSPRSAVIATYALCGFTHLASMAIFVGGISALAPEKTKEISRVAFRALFAATLACLMTGSVAGVFYNGESLLGF
jgi:CNT family concentrative nucleoside transporter